MFFLQLFVGCRAQEKASVRTYRLEFVKADGERKFIKYGSALRTVITRFAGIKALESLGEVWRLEGLGSSRFEPPPGENEVGATDGQPTTTKNKGRRRDGCTAVPVRMFVAMSRRCWPSGPIMPKERAREGALEEEGGRRAERGRDWEVMGGGRGG